MADPVREPTHPRAVELYELALAAREHSYSPYSRFAVGAAVLTTNGTVVCGANVDNASYPLTVCAETNAATTAIAQGARRLEAVAVAGPADTVSPCGACRQVLAEFGSDEMVVLFPRGGRLVETTLGELFPVRFRLR
jgi:cytidine deaminase